MNTPEQHDIYGKQNPDDIWFKLEEIAAILKCSISNLYSNIESGELRCARIGRKNSQGGIRVSRTMLEEFLRRREEDSSRKQPPHPPAAKSLGTFTELDPRKLRDAWGEQ